MERFTTLRFISSLLIFLLFINCQKDEDMSVLTILMSQQKLPSEVNIIISGQSIAQGQYPASTSGYSSAKLNNVNATYLECKTATHTWEQFTNKMMSPYQYSDPAVYGCSLEYSLAEYYTEQGITFNLYKPAWGAQKFGTDASPGKFHVSSFTLGSLDQTTFDSLIFGEITQDIVDIMIEQKADGVTFNSFLWMHGESDGRDALDSRNAYETNLRRFIEVIRFIQPNIPFYIRILPPETEDWMGAVVAGGRDAINTAITNVASDTPYVYTITMPSPFSQGDDIHPSNPVGNDQMALAYWNVLKLHL